MLTTPAGRTVVDMKATSRKDEGMCADDTPAHHGHSLVLHDVEPPVMFDLEPVDAVSVTTVMDNLSDVFMPHQGPAHRAPIASGHRRPAATMEAGDVPDALVAQHGLSLLVTITKGDRQHRILYDTGWSPDGAVEN